MPPSLFRARVAAPALSMAIVVALAASGVGVLAAGGAQRRADHASTTKTLPTIGNGSNLSMEPVVHADKAAPPTTLLKKDLVVGTGTVVTSKATVDVKYVGADYTNGKNFTAGTWTSGHATSFALSTVVPGFAEGLEGMKVGGRREIVIPPALGYKDQSDGPIKPNETLVFVVDLEGVTG